MFLLFLKLSFLVAKAPTVTNGGKKKLFVVMDLCVGVQWSNTHTFFFAFIFWGVMS